MYTDIFIFIDTCIYFDTRVLNDTSISKLIKLLIHVFLPGIDILPGIGVSTWDRYIYLG